jgi:hypothetical protein
VEYEPGSIVWVRRGNCNFFNKTLHAQNSGASGLVVANFGSKMIREDEILQMGCPSDQQDVCELADIPSMMVSFRDAVELQKAARSEAR